MGKKLSVLDYVFIGSLLAVFGGIVLHAPFTVGLSTLYPAYENSIKAWKEILLGLAFFTCVVILTFKKQWGIVRSKLMYYIALFAALNLICIPLFYTGFDSTVAGLFTNLRYLLFFALVFVAVRMYPGLYKSFLNVFIAGAVLVLGFAVLQVTVLPKDILSTVGYSESTIMPYLTVDQNEAYVRINSTLRGPNPLGIYALISLTFVIAAWAMRTRKFGRTEKIVLGIIGVGSLVALFASYSRSAALGLIVAVGIIVAVVYGRRLSKTVWVSLGLAALVVAGSLFTFRDTQFVSQVILHEDPTEGNTVNSNDGHAESLADGANRLVHQPLGAGIGSTGSASLLTDSPVIIENQYFFVAHETGWVGLTLFIIIYAYVLRQLWRRRAEWLALGVFASGVGIAVAGIFLPVWADDTVSIIWWGLAAMALAVPVAVKQSINKKGKRA